MGSRDGSARPTSSSPSRLERSRLEELAKRFPVHLRPSTVEVLDLILCDRIVIENELRAVIIRSELEAHDGVSAGRPRAGAPRLDDALAFDELDVVTADLAPIR